MKRILLCLAIGVVLVLMIPAIMGAMNGFVGDAVAVIGDRCSWGGGGFSGVVGTAQGQDTVQGSGVWMFADAEQFGTANALWSFSLNARITNTGETDELLEDVLLKVSKGREQLGTAKAGFGAGPVGLREGTILPYKLALPRHRCEVHLKFT